MREGEERREREQGSIKLICKDELIVESPLCAEGAICMLTDYNGLSI